MSKLIPITAAALLFAASAQATDSYPAFVDGNPDSDNRRAAYIGVTAAAPSVGADLDRYHAIDDGNPDLFSVELGSSTQSEDPNIYGTFGSSPDLSY
jgi:hypothetical protein